MEAINMKQWKKKNVCPYFEIRSLRTGRVGSFCYLSLSTIIENHRIGNKILDSQIQPLLWSLASQWKMKITFPSIIQEQILIIPTKQNQSKQRETFICDWGACNSIKVITNWQRKKKPCILQLCPMGTWGWALKGVLVSWIMATAQAELLLYKMWNQQRQSGISEDEIRITLPHN